MCTNIRYLCVAALASLPIVAPGEPPGFPSQRIEFSEALVTNLPRRVALVGVTHWTNGSFISVGASSRIEGQVADPGVVLLSSRIGQWQTTYTNAWGLRATAAGNGQLVAVGDGGSILTSADGIEWERATSPVTDALLSVVRGADLWMAVGLNGTIVTATDPRKWVDRSDPKLRGFSLYSVTYERGRFLASGGSHLGYVFSSTNGVNFQTNFLGFYSAASVSIAYGRERIVALTAPGLAWVSSDAASWTKHSLYLLQCGQSVNYARALTFAQGRFLAAAQDGVVSSADGMNWTRDFIFPDPCQPQVLRSIAFGQGRYVCVGTLSAAGDAPSVILEASGSKPRLDSVRRNGDRLSLTFSGGTAKRYRIDAAAELQVPDWRTVSETATDAGVGTATIEADLTAGAQFFRLGADDTAPARVD